MNLLEVGPGKGTGPSHSFHSYPIVTRTRRDIEMTGGQCVGL